MNDLAVRETDYAPREKCPLCGSSQQATYIPFPDIPIVRCRSCDFLFSARLMSDGMLEDYYKKGFGSERHRQGELINAKSNAWAISRILEM